MILTNNFLNKISQEEFKKILFQLPREIIIEPLKKKEFIKYTHGFRPNKLPNNRILQAYIDNIYENTNLHLINYVNKILEIQISTIDRNLNIKLDRSKNLSNEDINMLFKQFIDKKIEFDLLVYLKLKDIKINSDHIIYIENKQKEYSIKKELEKQVYNKLEKEFQVKLLQQIKQIEDNYENKIKKLQNKYKYEIKNKERLFESKVKELENKLRKFEIEKKEFESNVFQYIEKTKELEKKLQQQNRMLKEKEEYINEILNMNKLLKEEKESLSKEYKKLKKLTISAMVTKEDIKKWLLQDLNDNIEEEFKKYLNNTLFFDYKVNILDCWTKLSNIELEIIHDFMHSIIFERKLEKAQVDKLLDAQYSLRIRLILVKLFQAVGYKYIGNKIYEEIFNEDSSNVI